MRPVIVFHGPRSSKFSAGIGIQMRPPMPFPGAVTEFHGRKLPAQAAPAGYAALIEAYGLAVPLPRTLFAIGARHRIIEQGGFRLLTPRHAPPATLEGHLTFALKYEGLDLAVLDALFRVIDPAAIESLGARKADRALHPARLVSL
jgi:hypothetical protein